MTFLQASVFEFMLGTWPSQYLMRTAIHFTLQISLSFQAPAYLVIHGSSGTNSKVYLVDNLSLDIHQPRSNYLISLKIVTLSF